MDLASRLERQILPFVVDVAVDRDSCVIQLTYELRIARIQRLDQVEDAPRLDLDRFGPVDQRTLGAREHHPGHAD